MNMEMQLHYYIVLPLKEIIIRKVVAYLWNGSIFDPGEKLRDVWDVFEGDVKEKVSKLKLPPLIKNRMMNLVKPIGSDILNWQVFHEDNFVDLFEVFNIHAPQHLQRTRTGLIDYRRTAEELVRHEIFDTIKCFELACLYCLEDIILLIWGKFSEEDKDNFLLNVSISSTGDVVRNYWTYILRGDESFLDQFLRRRSRPSSIYYVAFEYAARNGNKSATEYFFHKLTQKERESSLLDVFFLVILERFSMTFRTLYFSLETFSDVLCYLLTVMTYEQQMQALVKYNHHLLICLLDWQLESIFFDIADLCWKFLIAEKGYGRLLYDMREFIIKTGYYIPHMFQNFFLNSPRNFRKHFVQRECQTYKYRSIFTEFLRAEDTETIEIIFKNIDATVRESLVFSVPVCKYLSHFILSGKWSFVEVCIRAAMLSKEDRKKLKWGLMYLARSLSRGIPTEWSTQKMKGFFEFLNEMDASWTIKRSATDENSHKIKKLCSGEN